MIKFIFRYNNKERKSGGSMVRYFNREILNYLLSIYKEIDLDYNDRSITFQQVSRTNALDAFDKWLVKQDKTAY